MTAGVEWTAGPRFGVSLGVFNPTFLLSDGWLKSRVDLMGVLKLKSTVDLAGVLKLKLAVDLPRPSAAKDLLRAKLAWRRGSTNRPGSALRLSAYCDDLLLFLLEPVLCSVVVDVFEGVFVETDEIIEAAWDTDDLFSDESSKAFLDSSDIFSPFTSLIFSFSIAIKNLNFTWSLGAVPS